MTRTVPPSSFQTKRDAIKSYIYDLPNRGSIKVNELRDAKPLSILARMVKPGIFNVYFIFEGHYKTVSNTRGCIREFRSALNVRNTIERYGHTNIHFEIWGQTNERR